LKKVLIITYYWPPSGKASLHYPLDLARYFPENGWEPVILTVDEEKFSHPDDSLLKYIAGMKIIRTKTWEPFDIYKKFTGKDKDARLIASETISTTNKKFSHRVSIWIRMNLFVPDARAGWYFYAVRGGREFLRKKKVDAIVSVGPPHTAHLVGKSLADDFNLPHYPVFIDPWVDIVYYRDFKRNPLTVRIDNYLENSVIKNAREVVFVTSSMKDDFIRKYPFLKDKSSVFYWGYNEDNFLSTGKINENREEEIIIHAGNIFDYQDVPMFWKKIKSEIEKGRKLRLRFIGTVSTAIKNSISSAGLDDYTDYKGFLPYNEMLSEIMNADFLFVCATEKRHVPGKLFEYMRTGVPVIAFGNDNSEVDAILKSTNSGKLFSYTGDGSEVLDNPGKFSALTDDVKKFDRRNIARNFSILLDRFTN